MSTFTFYDLRRREKGDDISLFFPDWQPGDERLAILSPHDDDAVLGTGYAIRAAQTHGGEVFVFIFADGCAGYSSPEEKDTIVETRARETIAAYKLLDIPEDNILRFNYHDFSVLPHLGLYMPWSDQGTIGYNLRSLRDRRITRILVPNDYREHIDHEAVYRAGAYDGPQVGDPILADWGLVEPIRSMAQYAVWGDFSPEDALVSGEAPNLRANRALIVEPSVEEEIRQSIRAFESQGQIIEGIIAARQGRRLDRGYLELYIHFDPRPPLDYQPYHHLINQIN